MNRYTLLLGDLYLAPRPSISVREPDDFESLIDADANNCACGSVLSIRREFTFRVNFLGRGSLATAWSMHAKLVQQLNQIGCQQVLLKRRVFDEAFLIYAVKKASLQMVNVGGQFACERVLSFDLKLTLASADNPILTIYEQARFPRLPVFIDFSPAVDAAIHEEATFPEPTDIFV